MSRSNSRSGSKKVAAVCFILAVWLACDCVSAHGVTYLGLENGQGTRLDKLRVQVEVYEGIARSDAYAAKLEDLDVMNAEQLVSFVAEQAAIDGFTSKWIALLQFLIRIPANPLVAQSVWNNVVHVVGLATSLQQRWLHATSEEGKAEDVLEESYVSSVIVSCWTCDVGPVSCSCMVPADTCLCPSSSRHLLSRRITSQRIWRSGGAF